SMARSTALSCGARFNRPPAAVGTASGFANGGGPTATAGPGDPGSAGGASGRGGGKGVTPGPSAGSCDDAGTTGPFPASLGGCGAGLAARPLSGVASGAAATAFGGSGTTARRSQGMVAQPGSAARVKAAQ